MKTFLASIVSAVIGGLILFLAQHWWDSSRSAAQNVIEFDALPQEVALKADDLATMSKALGKYENALTLHVITAKNSGTADLADRNFTMPNDFVKAYGTLDTPNSNPKNVSLSYDGKILTIHYHFLPAGTTHSFWYATDLFTTPTFSSDAPGVKVENGSPDSSEAFPWIWFGVGGGLLVALVFGVALGEASAAEVIKKAGYDYKQIRTLATQKTSSAAPAPPSVSP